MSPSTDHTPEASVATLHGDRVRYRNRQNGELVVERAPGLNALSWLYGTRSGAICLSFVARFGLFSDLCGWWQKKRFTRSDIRTFVERYNVDTSEIEYPLDHYKNFNDFFTRRLRQGTRPFCSEPDIFCSPADGKILVYSQLQADTKLPIKGRQLDIQTLLGGWLDAAAYHRGSAAIVRLAPYDYHRFHFPDEGEATTSQTIAGNYHSVNPFALEKKPAIFGLNKRSISQLNSPNFGQVALVEVGALNVASIVQTYSAGPVTRGQEKGYFQFGGSTIVLLFEPGRIAFDDDLIEESNAGLEVHVQTGERLGSRA